MPTYITEALRLVTQLQLFHTIITAYTALAYPYWASFNDAYECQGHAH